MSFLGQVQGFGSAILGNDYLRDYRHAAKTFRTKSYAFAPKYKFLFHTYFRINEAAYPEAFQKNFGVLVKDIKLPSYQTQTFQMNQYNRKRIVQTKIKYDPVNITFHDDNSNVINKMWYAYYTYYYTDATKPYVRFKGYRSQDNLTYAETNERSVPSYNANNIYNDDISGNYDWGYNGDSAQVIRENNHKAPFFKDITVFGFNQHNYTAYTLINPMITNFAHDTYNYEEGNGVMKNTMTVDYETVVYTEGAIDGRTPENIVGGFGDNATYDRKTSPIMKPGANGNILGPGGLVDGAGGVVNSFKSGGGLGILNAGITAARTYNTFKKGFPNNLVQTAKYEMMNMLAQSAWEYGSPIARNRNILFDMPNTSVTPYNIGIAGSPTIAPPEVQDVTTIPNKQAPTTAGVQVTSTNQVTGINFIPPYG